MSTILALLRNSSMSFMTRREIWSVKLRALVTSMALEREWPRKTHLNEPRSTWISTRTTLVASSRCSISRKWVDYHLRETSWTTTSKTAARTAVRSPSSSLNKRCNLSRWETCSTFSSPTTMVMVMAMGASSQCLIRWATTHRLSRCKEVGRMVRVRTIVISSSRWWICGQRNSNSRSSTHRLKATFPTKTCSNPSKRCQSSAKPTIWTAKLSKHNLTYTTSSNVSNSKKTCSLIIWTDPKVKGTAWIRVEPSSLQLRSKSNNTAAMQVAQIQICYSRRTIAFTRISTQWLACRSLSNTETEVTWWEGCRLLCAKLLTKS